MTKSNSSALSIVVPSILVVHFVNGAQFLNASVAWCPILAILPLTKM